MDQSLVSVMKSIGIALRLDSENNYQEGYIKYAECMLSIVSNLLHNVKTDGGKVHVSKEVIRHIQLGQQCMERLAALVQALVSTQNTPASSATPTSQSTKIPGFQGPSSFQLAKRFSEPVPPLQPDTSPYAFSRKHGPSPMELAYIRNQQIMSAYKSRLARMNKGSQATQLSLTIQRKMAENLAIAKAQETALAKKMNERQNRLEDQAKRRFTAPMGMSEEEQEQRQIYKKILEYEQDAKWLVNWREKLGNSPEDPIIINQLIQEILRCSDHPLTQLLKKYQYKIYERLYPLVCNKMKQLKDINVPLPSYLYPVDAMPKSPDTGRTKEELGDKDSCLHHDGEASSSSDTGRAKEELGDTDRMRKEMENTDSDNSDDHDSANSEHSSPKPFSVNDDKENDEGDNKEIDSPVEGKNSETETDVKDKDAEGTISKINSEASFTSADDDEGELAKIIKDAEDSNLQSDVDNDVSSDVDESSLKNVEELVEESQETLESAIGKGKKLEKQLTIENESASAVIQRISEYEKYNEENMDDLFDDDDDDVDNDDRGMVENDKPESERGITDLKTDSSFKDVHSDDQMPSMGSIQGDKTLNDKVFSEGDASLPSVGSISKSLSMDSGPASLPAFPSSDTSSLTSSRSVDSMTDDNLSKMSEDAYRRHLSGISQDVHSFLEKLLLMFTIAYENLDSPTGRDQCIASLEEPFFKPIWKYILALFRLANRAQEKTLAYKMTTRQNSEPKDFFVSKKLWLESSSKLPYHRAVEELQKVKEYYTMLSKLECVVRVCREVCTSVEEYYTTGEGESGKKSPPSVGADDLLPILSYIVVKSELPQLVSECQAMAEFIHEGYIMGEEGYCLTSLQTAVNYLTV